MEAHLCHRRLLEEYLRAVDDQITQSTSCGQKFSDDDAYKGEADIDLNGADDRRDAAWQNNFGEAVFFCSAKRAYQDQLIVINFVKAGIQADDRTEYGYGDSGYDDGFCPGAQPYDKERGQS